MGDVWDVYEDCEDCEGLYDVCDVWDEGRRVRLEDYLRLVSRENALRRKSKKFKGEDHRATGPCGQCSPGCVQVAGCRGVSGSPSVPKTRSPRGQ